MLIVLQDMRSLEFLRSDGGWTPVVEQAHDFGMVGRALDCALSRGLRNVRPVIKCRDPQWDVVLPPVRLGN